MRIVLYTILGLLAFLVAGALALPFVVDLNDYKGQISARVKQATGRDLTIAGNIDLALLPVPKVAVNDVRLANLPGAATADTARVARVEVSVALGPLLRGEVQFESVTIVDPVVELELLADGRANWLLVPAGAGAAPGPGAQADEGGGLEMRLDSLVVENATIVYRDSTQGRIERVSGLDVEASAGSLTGPYRAEGRLVARGVPLAFKLAVGALDRSPIPIGVDLVVGSNEASMSFSGSLTSASADAEVSGRLKIEGGSLARLVTAIVPQEPPGAPLPAALARAFSLTGRVAASAAAAAINDAVIEFDGVQATGAVSAAFGDVPEIDVALALNRIDLDRLLARGESAEAAAPSPAAPGGAAPFALPGGVNATVDIRANGVVYNQSVVRQVQVVAALGDGVLTLQQASALLPGGSDVTVFGVLDSADDAPRFTGQVEASADNLRAALNWLGVPVPAVPAGRLRKLSFSTKIEVTPTLAKLSALDVTVDNSRLSGGINLALARRPAFNAIVTLDRVNLDGYLPRADAAAAPAAPGSAPDAAGTGPFALLAAFDGELKARIGALVYNAVPVTGLAIDAGLRGGTLTLRSLTVDDMAGAGGALSGTVEASPPGFDLTYNLGSADPDRLLRAFDVTPPAPAQGLGRLTALGRVKGDLSSVTLDTTVTVPDAQAKFAGTVSGLAETPGIDASVELRGESLARLARRFGAELPVPPAGQGAAADGPFSLEGRIKGAVERAEVAFEISAAGIDATIDGVATGLDGAPGYDLTVTARHPDLAALAGTFGGAATPAGRDLGEVRLGARVVGDGLQVRVSDIDAVIGPTAVSGRLAVRWDGPRPSLDAELAAGEIVADMFVSAARRAKPKGERWSREPIDLSGLAALDAKASITADALVLGKVRIDDVSLRLTLADGRLDIEELAGNTYGAPARITARLDAAGTPAAVVALRLDGADLRALLVDAAGIDAVSGRLDLSGQFQTQGRSELELVSGLSGEAVVSAREGRIDGIDLGRLNRRLGSLNSEADFLNLAGTALSGGTTAIESLDGSVTASGGVLRSDDLVLALDGGQGRATATVDLPRWHLALDSEFALTGHPNAPAVGITLEGPLDNPRRQVHDQALRAHVARKLVGGVLRKVVPAIGDKAGPAGLVGGLLDALTGGAAAPPAAQEAPAESAPAPEPAPPPTPEKAFENLLKGVIRGLGN